MITDTHNQKKHTEANEAVGGVVIWKTFDLIPTVEVGYDSPKKNSQQLTMFSFEVSCRRRK